MSLAAHASTFTTFNSEFRKVC